MTRDFRIDQHTAAGSGAEPWHIAGYVFVAGGAGLLAFTTIAYAAQRVRTWREQRPEKGLTLAEFADALADAETARLLRVVAPLNPYAVEIDAEQVGIRLAGIDTPAPSGPWTVDGDDDGQVRSAPRERLAEADEADGHPYIAVGTRGTVLVFIDPTHSPGLITVDGAPGAATELAELLGQLSAAAGHAVRFAAGPADGAQWRWSLAPDGTLDTGVLGVRVQMAHLAAALAGAGGRYADPDEAVSRRGLPDAGTRADEVAALPVGVADRVQRVDEPDVQDVSKAQDDLLGRLTPPGAVAGSASGIASAKDPVAGTATEPVAVSSTATSAKALAVARAEPSRPGHDFDLDAVSGADAVGRADAADLE